MKTLRKYMTRETFMGLFIASVGGVGGLIIGIPIIGFVFAPLIREPGEPWRDVGAVTDFTQGKTVEVTLQYGNQLAWAGPTKNSEAWVRRDAGDQFTAFAVYCTHLGCPVEWFQTPQLFMCPCHGSVFQQDGSVAAGPAPRPLFQYPTRVRNGRVEVKPTHLPVPSPLGGHGIYI